MNDAFLMKVGWKFIVEPHSLCSQVLRGKYSRNRNLRRDIVVKEGDSLLWKEIGRLWPLLYRNQRWVVGCGNEVFFWTDSWMGNGDALINNINFSFPMRDMGLLVKDMVDGAGCWDYNRLNVMLGDVDFKRIISEVPLKSNGGYD